MTDNLTIISDCSEGTVTSDSNLIIFSNRASNPEIKQFMEEHKFGKNYSLLQTYYFEQVVDMLKLTEFVHHPFTPVAWQEVFDRGFRVSE